MEVKINREIRNYSESVFFGLTLRQCIFSVLAVAVAAGLYLLLKPMLGVETVSWVCIVGAAPFAALGFVTYHGMTCERFVCTWVRSELLEPKRLTFKPNNIYYEALREQIRVHEKEAARDHDKDTAQSAQAKPGAVRRSALRAGRDPHSADMV